MTVKDLSARAKELRLTRMQREFCEHLVADPDRNQRQAALAAGASKRGTDSIATKWLRLAKVQKYLAAISAVAEANLEKRTGRACASLEEVLEILTFQARARIGDYLRPDGELDLDAVRAAPAGVVRAVDVLELPGEDGGVVRKVKVDASQGAAEKLLKYHVGAYTAERDRAAQPSRINVNALILIQDPAVRQMLAQKVRIIETDVVPS